MMKSTLLGTVPIGQNGFQPLPITRPKPDLDVAAHARVIQQDPSLGNILFPAEPLAQRINGGNWMMTAGAHSNPPQYVLLTAARNEAAYVGRIIQAVASQSVLPARWLIIDDGSTDGTSDVVAASGGALDFLRCVRRNRANGSRDFHAKSEALHLAWQHLEGLAFDYVGVLDADTEVSPDYYERVIALLERDRQLGVAGGWVWEAAGDEFQPRLSNRERSVQGGSQVFRRACFEAIGGIPPLRCGGEDTLAEVYAEMRGWTVRAYQQIPVRHLRPAGSSNAGPCRAAILEGRREYHLG